MTIELFLCIKTRVKSISVDEHLYLLLFSLRFFKLQYRSFLKHSCYSTSKYMSS